MGQEQSFCLFRGDAGPMAVAVESVAEVLETESLVPLAWSPPQVVGLCPNRREVVPVISMGPTPRGEQAGQGSGAGPHPVADSELSPGKARRTDPDRCLVLILRTEDDLWGIRIDSEGTFISRETPQLHPARTNDHAAVLIGIIKREETPYALFDAEATWRALRAAIARWYGFVTEPRLRAPIPLGEEARTARTGAAG